MVQALRRDESLPIREAEFVRVKETGNVIEVLAGSNGRHEAIIKKLSATEYQNVRTGEVKEFKKYEKRTDDMKELARSIAYGRDVINTNVKDPKNVRWITLTYKENMKDPKRLMHDFEIFVKKARRKWGAFEYITASEPQERGAWHLHVILIYSDTAPYMANADVSVAWGQGFVNVRAVDDIDNLGAYLSAYLGNAEVQEGAAETETTEKKYIKGARLCMYPAQFHIFRWSKGIKKPTVYETTYQDLKEKEKVSAGTLTFSKTIDIVDAESGYHGTLRYEYYNTSRKHDTTKKQKSQEQKQELNVDPVTGEVKPMPKWEAVEDIDMETIT